MDVYIIKGKQISGKTNVAGMVYAHGGGAVALKAVHLQDWLCKLAT